MRNAIDFRPIPGQVTNVLLLYDKGVYEIINDSPFRLSVNGIGGSVHIEAGAKMLYSNQRGGNAIQIQALSSITLDGTTGDILAPFGSPNTVMPPITINSSVMVNEYYPDEVISTAYPASLSRTSLDNIARPNPFWFTMVSQAGPITFSLPILFSLASNQTQMWITGFDFTGQEAGTTTTNHLLTIDGLMALQTNGLATTHQMQWSTATSPNTKAELFVRFPYPLINRNNATAITFTLDQLDVNHVYNLVVYAFLL